MIAKTQMLLSNHLKRPALARHLLFSALLVDLPDQYTHERFSYRHVAISELPIDAA